MGDNSPKPLGGGTPPKDGDLLRFDEDLGQWETYTFAELVADILDTDEFAAAVDAIINP